jgi:hypothetical protein
MIAQGRWPPFVKNSAEPDARIMFVFAMLLAE